MNKETYKKVCRLCRFVRKRVFKTQLDVALDTGYAVSTVSYFEKGINNNAVLFIWYLQYFTVDDLNILNSLIKDGEAYES